MYKIVLLSSTFWIYLNLTKAQIERNGTCKEIPSQSNFKREGIGGIWYLMTRTPRSFEGGKNVKCTTVKYDIHGDFKKVTRWWIDTSNNVKHIFEGNASLYTTGTGETADGVFYNVIATDYVNYLTIYGCNNKGSSRLENIWIFLRNQEYNDKFVDYGILALRKNDINYEELFPISQEECPSDWPDSVPYQMK